jgi:hypothetical protein
VPYSLIVDVIVLGLLVIMIPYIFRLNKRLSMLRRDKAQLEKLAVTFADSTRRADESLGGLKASAENMQRKLDSAQALHDDLAFLLERGEKAADRLEDLVRQSRPETPPVPAMGTTPAPTSHPVAKKSSPPTATPQNNDDGGDSLRSEAERELLKAIRSSS